MNPQVEGMKRTLKLAEKRLEAKEAENAQLRAKIEALEAELKAKGKKAKKDEK